MSIDDLSNDIVSETSAVKFDPYNLCSKAAEDYFRENMKQCAERNRELLTPIYKRMGGAPVIIGPKVGYFFPKSMLPETRQMLKENGYKGPDGNIHPDLIKVELPSLWHFFG